MKRRIVKKKNEKKAVFQLNRLFEKMDAQGDMMDKILDSFDTQQEILERYYQEYQELKRKNQKQYLMGYIRLRDDMLKDVDRMKESGNIDENMLRLLGGYIDTLTMVLEDNGVDIYCCYANDEYDTELQKPLEKVHVCREELGNRIVKVFGCGYRWHGMILKKVNVSVGIYNH